MKKSLRRPRGAGRFTALLLVALPTVLSAAPASAGQGVKLSHGSVVIDQPLFRGSTRQLPEVTVTNPGDLSAEYQMTTLNTESDAANIPPGWLLISPSTFDLEPGSSRVVEAALNIPEDAPLGDYAGLLAAQLVASDSAGSGTGARLGAGAAAHLSFEVASRTILERWVDTASATWISTGVWGWVFVGCFAVGALVALLRRRYELKIERR